MSLLLTGKGGRRYEWIAPIDPADVVFAGLGLFPESGDWYHDATEVATPELEGNTLPPWTRHDQLGWGLRLDQNELPRVNTGRSYAAAEGAVAAWVYINTITFSFLFAQRPTASGSYFSIGPETGGYLRMRVAGPTYTALTPAGTIANGQTCHIAGTWGPAGLKIYVDGRVVATNAYTGGFTLNATMFIGVAEQYLAMPTPSAHFHGDIYSPLILHRQPADEQIAWLADPANRPVRPWRRRALPSAGGAILAGEHYYRHLLGAAA